MEIDLESWKARIRTVVGELRAELVALSHDIHAHPELAFNEHRASASLANALERGGLRVERGVGGLATAFRAALDGGEPGTPAEEGGGGYATTATSRTSAMARK